MTLIEAKAIDVCQRSGEFKIDGRISLAKPVLELKVIVGKLGIAPHRRLDFGSSSPYHR
jgi:hypothetical protein